MGRRNKMVGTSEQFQYILRDESMHMNFGIDVINQIIEWRGKPQSIRVDIGPENVTGLLKQWAEKRGITIQYIQPGKPQQSAIIARFDTNGWIKISLKR